jgi:hypothetical protein
MQMPFVSPDLGEFEEKAAAHIARGDLKALKKLYTATAAQARGVGGDGAGRHVESILRSLLNATARQIKRGIFNDL